MMKCRVLDCIYNNREEEESGRCAFDEDKREVNDRGNCISYEMDHSYLKTQLHQLHGINHKALEAQSYENTVLHNAIKLRQIINGKRASHIMTNRVRNNLRKTGILKMSGNRLELTPQAQAILERNEK